MRRSVFPRSGVLLLGGNSVTSLLPATLISQVESLLESHRIDDAAGLAEQQRKKFQGKGTVDEDEADELRYAYQRIGFQCLGETLFEDAGRYLFHGDLDPRGLVSYFPELRGELFGPTDSIDVFAGVADHMPSSPSVDHIIVANLVRNYSPHLPPDTMSAPPTAELRKILNTAATEMLEAFLRKARKRRRSTTPVLILEVVDTIFAKLLAMSEKTAELYELIQEPNHLVLTEVEAVFTTCGQYNALCMLYKNSGNTVKLLESWSKLVAGEWTDLDIEDPLSNMITLLTEKRDRKLTQQWAVWLMAWDSDRALKLLISRDTGKRRDRPEDDLAMLEQIRRSNLEAGAQFLEHLVLYKRSMSAELHMQLAMSCVDQLLACADNETTSKLWRAKASSYASSRTDTPYLSYFASTTPESESKRVRLKTVLFLQGSTLYDCNVIRERLMAQEKLLKLELAIVDGKLSNHQDALTSLVRGIRDSTSAEAYCTLGGDVVPTKTAQVIGETYNLQIWASALFPSPSPASRIVRQKTVDEGLKTELLKILLAVYMADGDATAERSSHLLNSQAMNLDVLDVIELVPPDWPLSGMSSFLARSFRRTLHAHHEQQIVKAISAGQNLETAEKTWLVIRERGAMVEEAAEDDEDAEDDDNEGEGDEKVFSEKIGLPLDDVVPLVHALSPEETDKIERWRSGGEQDGLELV